MEVFILQLYGYLVIGRNSVSNGCFQRRAWESSGAAGSVADPGCLSRILIFYPSRIPDTGSRIPDPKTATKERGEKKFVVIPFYVATNFTKLNIIFVLKCRRKKFGPIFKEL
jgi:hypothetical protein